MSEVAATPAVENAEIAPVEVNRITQRRASAIARDEDRKAYLEGKGAADGKGFWAASTIGELDAPEGSPSAEHATAKKTLA